MFVIIYACLRPDEKGQMNIDDSERKAGQTMSFNQCDLEVMSACVCVCVCSKIASCIVIYSNNF